MPMITLRRETQEDRLLGRVTGRDVALFSCQAVWHIRIRDFKFRVEFLSQSCYIKSLNYTSLTIIVPDSVDTESR
jgi:hypothetical protein